MRTSIYYFQELILTVAENFVGVEREEQEASERAIIIDLLARCL
jgi:hypothetical protein